MRRLVALLVVAAATSLAAPAAVAQFRRDKRFAERRDLARMATIIGLNPTELRPTLGGVVLRYRATDQTALGLVVGCSVSTQDGEVAVAEADGDRVDALESHEGA